MVLCIRLLDKRLALPMQVLCVGSGEAVGFEREFVNPSHEEGVFEVSTSAAAGELALVAGTQEWQTLVEAAGHAGRWVCLGSCHKPSASVLPAIQRAAAQLANGAITARQPLDAMVESKRWCNAVSLRTGLDKTHNCCCM